MLQNKESIKEITKDLRLELSKDEVISLDGVLDNIDTNNLNDIITFIKEKDLENDYLEVIEKVDNEINNSDDFYIEIGNQEYRFIHNNIIDTEFYDYNVELVDDCYLNNVPEMVKSYFDYDKFVSDCMYDGYANTFSSYDGRTEIELSDYRVFRTN